MSVNDKVSAYIDKHAHWREELHALRALFHDSELEEDIKWGAPAYILNGKIVEGLGAFKNHLGLWFHQGVFLKDVQHKLLNAQEVKTKALRQWRIEKGDTLEKKLIAQYIQEAVENSLAGKEIKPQRTKIKDITIPAELYTAFNEDSALKPAFDALSPGKKKEYAGYISDAKREATKISRLEKIIPMILAGQGLHDIYKNC